MAPRSILLVLGSFLAGVIAAGLHRPHIALIAALALLLSGSGLRVTLIVAFCIGLAYYNLYFLGKTFWIKLPNDGIEVRAVIVSEPRIYARYSEFTIQLQPPHRGNLKILADTAEDYQYGDILSLRGSTEHPDGERQIGTMYFPDARRVSRKAGNSLRQNLLRLKHYFLSPIEKQLSPTEAAFLGGITLGARQNMPAELRESLRKSGTAHLVALSGYNVSIVIAGVFTAARFFLERRLALVFTFAAIIGFGMMAGGEPSVVRASLMAAMFLISAESGRMSSLPHALLWSAVLITLFDPGSIFRLGFQLSYLSLIGVAYIGPALRGIFAGENGLSETIRATIGAQVAVIPALLWSMGNISATAIFANSLISPFIPWTMLLGCLLALFGSVSSSAAVLLSLVAHALLRYEIGVIKFFG